MEFGKRFRASEGILADREPSRQGWEDVRPDYLAESDEDETAEGLGTTVRVFWLPEGRAGWMMFRATVLHTGAPATICCKRCHPKSAPGERPPHWVTVERSESLDTATWAKMDQLPAALATGSAGEAPIARVVVERFERGVVTTTEGDVDAESPILECLGALARVCGLELHACP